MGTLSLSGRSSERLKRMRAAREQTASMTNPTPNPESGDDTKSKNTASAKSTTIEDRATLHRETDVNDTFYTGAQLEEKFIGTSGMNFDYQEYRNQMTTLVNSGVPSVEWRNGDAVMKKHLAIAAVLGIEVGGAKIELRQKLAPYAELLQRKLQTLDSSFTFVPTTNSPMDFDYGTDAMIHKAQTDAEKRQIMRGKRPYVSFGVTAADKRLAGKQKGKTVIQSDVEVRLPGKRSEFEKLNSDQFKLDRFLDDIATAVQGAYEKKRQAIAEGKSQHIAPHWIDYTDYWHNDNDTSGRDNRNLH